LFDSDDEDVEDAKDVEYAEDAEDVEYAEDAEYAEDVEDDEDDQQFQVYTVVDPARKIEQENISMINSDEKSSNRKSASKKSQPSKSPQSVQKPPVQHSKVQEEAKSPMKSDISNLEEAALKYRIPVAKMNLQSVAFSDIVNYESNDDMVSLTGDRKTKRSNFQGSNNAGSTKNSVFDNKSPPGFYNFSRPQANTEYTQPGVQEIVLNNEHAKDDLDFFTKKLNQVKRESDIVIMDNSSNRTSVMTNQIRPTVHNGEVQQKAVHTYIPKAEVADHDSPQRQYELIEKDSQRHQNQDIVKHQPLKRISEEIAQSKDTVNLKGSNRSSEKKNSFFDHDVTPIKPSAEFKLQESYTDMVAFDETEQPKDNRSPFVDKSIVSKTSVKKAKTHRVSK
jgi:hypothetical protein